MTDLIYLKYQNQIQINKSDTHEHETKIKNFILLQVHHLVLPKVHSPENKSDIHSYSTVSTTTNFKTDLSIIISFYFKKKYYFFKGRYTYLTVSGKNTSAYWLHQLQKELA